jgi:hypothetical protein
MAFRTALQGLGLGAVIGGSFFGAMRKQALHEQEQLSASVRQIQADFKTPEAAAAKKARAPETIRISLDFSTRLHHFMFTRLSNLAAFSPRS